MKTNKKSKTVDDSLMTKEEFLAKIERGLGQVERGEGVACKTYEESLKFLGSI
jgi:hypothetical protein